MRNFKINQLLRKKGFVLTFLIVCSLLISEKAVAIWGEDCCELRYEPKDNHIRICYKFFEFDIYDVLESSFLKQFEVQYSTDGGQIYTLLMSTFTEDKDQTSKTSAWIKLQNKKKGEFITLLLGFKQENPMIYNWVDAHRPRLYVNNHFTYKNQTWLWVDWFPCIDQGYVTNIRIKGKWYDHGRRPNKCPVLYYTINQMKLNSNSLNFSNSSAKQEIRIEDTINTINAYKEANAIVVDGAVNEKIQVYTTTGKLVKSMVADCDVLQIPVPANQLYIVHVGEKSYKIAL